MPATTPAGIDVPALTTLLDGKYAVLREVVRKNLIEHQQILDEAETLSTTEFRERVKDVVVSVAEQGQGGYGFPKEYGGGEDYGANVAGFETLAFGDLSVLVKLGVQFGLFGGAVFQLGTKRHHDRYVADLIQGKLMGSFAMTETGHGSNVQAIGTTASYDVGSSEFIINTPDDASRKDYIGNAAMHARAAAVFAQLIVGGDNKGVHALYVPLRDEKGKVLPGIRIEDCGKKLGLNGVDNGRIWFDHVRVPRENLLNRYADVTEAGEYVSAIDNPDRRFFTMLGTLVQGRVCVGGAGINASKVGLTIATRYADRRRQFGPPGGDEMILLDYGMHQRRLIPLIARTYALHFAQERLAADMHEVFSDPDGTSERKRRGLESRAAATKALGTWHATWAIQECREACGGAGYLALNRFAALKADTDVFTTFEGDNTILLQLVAKGRLTDLKDEFGSLDQIGMVRFVAQQAVDVVVEKTNMLKLIERLRDVVPGRQDDDDPDGHLLDPDYHLSMFRWREDHMTQGAARRIKGGIDRGGDPAEVFSRCQDHVIGLARAHAERLVLEAFLTKIEQLEDGPNKLALNMLCDLYALSELERDRAWWMEHGRLSTDRAKAITRMVNDLCRSLRPAAVDLVNAFGVPEEMLRSNEILG
ncbi:MAG TPA: acyl-CoA dehydrogenase [Nocardioidaceae bacterium]|nr:acyl-CoA dehydrogenase [Nocardioidaceae bacterium]